MEPTTPLGSPRTAKGTPLGLFLGPLVIVAGIAALALMARGVRPAEEHPRSPLAVQVGMTLFGMAVGAWMTVDGYRAQQESARRWKLIREGPRTAWGVDHPWNPAGARDGVLEDAAAPLQGGIAMLLLMEPYTEIAFFSPTGTGTARLIMAGGNLLAALLLARGGYLLARRFRFGLSTLEFASFPFFLGGTLEAVFRTSAGAEVFDDLLVTLRCIQEVSEPGLGTERSPRVIWKTEQVVPAPRDPVRLKIELPDDPALASRVSAPDPRYWKLEVLGRRPGIDFRAEFLVPVYAPAPEVRSPRAVKPR